MIAFALATALTAPTFVPVARGADPAPDPSTPNPDPSPDSSPDPAPTQSSTPPPTTTSTPPVQSTSTPAPVEQSTAAAPAKPKAKKRAHPSQRGAELRQGASVPKGRRSRDGANATFAAAGTSTPATAAPQLASVPGGSASSSSAMVLLAALAAGLTAMLLAAVPAYALWRTWVFRPLVNRRFELGVAGVSILAGLVFAKGLLGT